MNSHVEIGDKAETYPKHTLQLKSETSQAYLKLTRTYLVLKKKFPKSKITFRGSRLEVFDNEGVLKNFGKVT